MPVVAINTSFITPYVLSFLFIIIVFLIICENHVLGIFLGIKKLGLFTKAPDSLQMAERVGFEPTVPLTGHLISSQAPSTSRTPLQSSSIRMIAGLKTLFVFSLS